MDDKSLLLSLGVVRPSPRSALSAFEDAFSDAAPRPGSRRRIFDERTTVGLMLGQALNRNDPCKNAVRRVQVEFGMDASSSTAAYCKARACVRRRSDGIFRGKEWCRKSRPGDVRIGDGDWLAT